MITREIIARINELAKKQQAGQLSAAERTEQAQLRRQYIDNIKSQLKAQLDNIEIYDEENCSGRRHEQ